MFVVLIGQFSAGSTQLQLFVGLVVAPVPLSKGPEVGPVSTGLVVVPVPVSQLLQVQWLHQYLEVQ